jgi:hypothetical protein
VGHSFRDEIWKSDMTDKELQVIFSALDDCRRLIAAGKVQRWDVIKWGVAVNVGLATAAAAIPFKGASSFIPFGLGVLVAIMSWLLMSHYNLRLTRTRDDARYLVDQIDKKGIDYDGIVGTNVALDYAKGPDYDKEELRIFKLILIVSPVLPLLAALFRAAAN